MENLLAVEEKFSETVSRYLSREAGKGKDMRKTMERLMGNWVLNALVITKRAEKANIKSQLMAPYRGRIPTTRAKRSKLAHEMAETNALVHIRHINYKGARGLSFAELRKLARVYIARRVFAAGLHRAGYIPALRKLRRSAGERPPRYKNEPGTEPQWPDTPESLPLEVMNFAKVIATISPMAFEHGATKLQGFLAGYLSKDLTDEMNRAGLNAK